MTSKRRPKLIGLLVVSFAACAAAEPAPPLKNPAQPAKASADAPFFAALIVEVAALPATLATPDGRSITVLDARGPIDFAAGHIPGARRMTWQETARSGLREGRLASPSVLARRFADNGVDDRRPVLVCGAGKSGWGEEGRLAWTLRYLGHRDVAVLGKGCASWGEAGRGTSMGPVFGAAKGHFSTRVDADWRIDRAGLKVALGQKAAPTVLDVRTREEYEGATPYFSERGGHIAGAQHLPLTALYDADGTVVSSDVLQKRLDAMGVPRDRLVALYCTGGVRSAMAALILRQAGYKAVNYDGSWWDWAADPEAPVDSPQPVKQR